MKKKVAFIVIPIIVLAIVGIWFLKNGSNKKNISSEIQTESQENVIQETDSLETRNDLNDDMSEDVHPDFSLAATELVDYEALSKFGYPIIVDYGSDECIPCKQMAPVLETLNEELQGRAFVKFVDVWKYPEAAANAPIQVIPTQVFFNADGTPFVPSGELASKIPFDMYSSKETGEHVFTVHQGGITEAEMRLILAEMGVTE